MNTIASRIVDYLTERKVPFELIRHPPAASAEEYSRVVGSALHEQSKALLLRRYPRTGGKDFVIHALPGDQRGDLDALAGPLAAKRLRMANADELKQSTGCDVGELPSIGSVFGLPLSMDARLLAQPRIFFNAGALDRSVVLDPRDLNDLESPIIVVPQAARPEPE
jgi:Ala-tRNA(Pro) deacylase